MKNKWKTKTARMCMSRQRIRQGGRPHGPAMGLGLHGLCNARRRQGRKRENKNKDVARKPRWCARVVSTSDASTQVSQTTDVYDLLIVGAGPSGLAVAERVAASGRKVCVIDPAPQSVWPNNYGVWVDEFEAMGLEDCIDKTWAKASVYLENNSESKRLLSRPYGRVDRKKLKQRFYDGCLNNGVTFVEAYADQVQNYSPAHSKLILGKERTLSDCGYSEISCSNGTMVQGKLLLDATGHVKKFTKFDNQYDPGYQGAYGILVDVDSHPFALDEMLFMDWRDDHLEKHPSLYEKNKKLPTFLYAMPFGEKSIFLEETSLVARPAVPFDELKERLNARLDHLQIKINKVHEEEYCLIPMGSSLPYIPQRVIGIGGTAGMVHPSTGYMVARMLGAAPVLADAIIDQLSGGQPSFQSAPQLNYVQEDPSGSKLKNEVEFNETGNEATIISKEIWQTIWPNERLQQREFFNFGMEILLTLNLAQTREFFSAFFSLSDYYWQGFLSSRLSLVELVTFGLSLFSKCTNAMRAWLIGQGVNKGLYIIMTNIKKEKM